MGNNTNFEFCKQGSPFFPQDQTVDSGANNTSTTSAQAIKPVSRATENLASHQSAPAAQSESAQAEGEDNTPPFPSERFRGLDGYRLNNNMNERRMTAVNSQPANSDDHPEIAPTGNISIENIAARFNNKGSSTASAVAAAANTVTSAAIDPVAVDGNSNQSEQDESLIDLAKAKRIYGPGNKALSAAPGPPGTFQRPGKPNETGSTQANSGLAAVSKKRARSEGDDHTMTKRQRTDSQ